MSISMPDDTSHAQLHAPYTACCNYFDQVRTCVNDNGPVPDITAVLNVPYSKSSLDRKPLKAGTDTKGPFVEVWVHHRAKPGRPFPSKPHLYDPAMAVIMRGLELLPKRRGQHYRLNGVTPTTKQPLRLRYFITYTLISKTCEVQVRRLVMDTPKGQMTPDNGNYHDQRKSALRTELEAPFKAATDFKGNSPQGSRVAFLQKLETSLIKRYGSAESIIPGINVTVTVYVTRLGEWFTLYDRMSAIS